MIPGAIIGGQFGLFFMGLIYLIKGEIKMSKTQIAKGSMIRLGSLIVMLPMLVNFLISVIGGTRQDNWLGYFSQFVVQLMSPLGIGIGIVCAIIGMLVMYAAPKTPITS